METFFIEFKVQECWSSEDIVNFFRPKDWRTCIVPATRPRRSKMTTSRLLVMLIAAGCCAILCNGSQSCGLLHQNVTKEIDRVLVSERHSFGADFRNFCLSYEKEKWLSLTKGAVCFGGSGNEYATLVVPIEGFLMSVKLTHVSGLSSCKRNSPQYNSNWGCSRNHPEHGRSPFNVVVTTAPRNDILFPTHFFHQHNKGSYWYDKPEVDPHSPEIILTDASNPIYVAMGQELRVWFGEDLLKSGVKKKGGKVCITAQAWYKHWAV